MLYTIFKINFRHYNLNRKIRSIALMGYIHESWCSKKKNDTQGIRGYIKLAIKIFLFDKRQ